MPVDLPFPDTPFHERHDHELLTFEEATEILKTSPRNLRWWRQHGTSPDLFKIGKRHYIHIADQRTWIRPQRLASHLKRSESTEEAAMTVDPLPDLPAEWFSDKQDLAELVKGVKPYTGGDEYTIPDFFASDEEQQEFIAWVRAERDKELV